ncbi:DUF4169 family protein [Sphingobium ummariense]
MADIINLRMARKAKARADAERQAAANRAKFGRSKAERQQIEREAAKLAKALDGAERDRGDT